MNANHRPWIKTTALRTCYRVLMLLGVAAVVVMASGAPAKADLPSIRVATGTQVTPTAANSWYGNSSTSTVDLWSTGRPDEIKDLARGLRYDVDLIYEYVRNNIDIVPIYGLQKGALGAIYDQTGTAFDQVHLMYQLLKEADAVAAKGYNPKIKAGIITLTVAQAGNWLGLTDAAGNVSSTALQEVLKNGGIPYTISGSNVTLAHVWIEVTITGSSCGSTCAFDPALKTYTYKSGITSNLGTILQYSETDLTGTTKMTTSSQYGASYVQNVIKSGASGINGTMDTYAGRLLTNLKNTNPGAEIEDVVGGALLDPATVPVGGVRQAAIPNSPTEMRSWPGGVPDKYRTKLTVQIQKSGTTYINKTYYVDEFYGRRFRFLTNGGGTFLYVGNVQQATAVFPSTSILDADIVLIVDHPYAANASGGSANGTYMDETITKNFSTWTLYNGSPNNPSFPTNYVLVHGWGDSGTALLKKFELETRKDGIDGNGVFPFNSFQDNAITQNHLAQQHLSPVAAAWVSEFSRVMKLIGRVSNAVIQHHHSLGFELGHYSSSGVLTEQDVDSVISVTNKAGSSTDRKAAIHTLAAAASALEAGTIQRTYEIVDAASAVTLFDYSNQEGSKFFFADSNTFYSTPTPSALYSAMATTGWSSQELAAIESYTLGGYTIIVPLDGDIGAFYSGYITWGAPPLLAFRTAAPDKISYLTVGPSGSSPGDKGGGANVGAGGSLLSSTLQTLTNIEKEPDAYQYFAVDTSSGGLKLTPPADISVGSGEFPYKLEFSRIYDATNLSNGGLGLGWTHNYDITATVASNPYQAYGQDSGLEASQTIAGLYTMFRLAQAGQTAPRLVAGVFVANWWKESLVDNIVNVSFPGQTMTFTRLADGTYNPPRGSQDSIQLNSTPTKVLNQQYFKYGFWGTSMTLNRGDGSSLTFQSLPASGGTTSGVTADPSRSFQITSWTFPTGMSLSFTYEYTNPQTPTVKRLTSVANNLGRVLTLTGGTNNNTNESTIESVADGEGHSVTFTQVPVVFWQTGQSDSGGGIPAPVPDFAWRYSLFQSVRPGDTSQTAETYTYYGFAGQTGGGTSPILAKMWPTLPASFDDQGFLEFTYTADRLIKTVEDASQRVTNYYVGALADENYRRGEVVNAAGETTTTIFDKLSRPLANFDGLGRLTTNEYDVEGRLARTEMPEGNAAEYLYDSRHNRIKTTQKQKPGSTPTLPDLVTEATYATSCTSGNKAFCNKPATTKDARLNTTTYGYFTSGLVQTITGPAVTGGTPLTTYTYNSYGQMLQETVKVSATENLVTAYTYDTLTNHSRLLSVKTDPSGFNFTTTLGYDTVGNVTSINGPRTDVTDVTTIAYEARRRITQITRPEGAQSKYTWNANGTLLKAERLKGANTWLATAYEYTPTLRRSKITEPGGDFSTIAYDAVDRVLVTTDPVGRKTKNIYDSAGELTNVIQAWQGITNACTDGTSLQQCAASYSYTLNGKQATATDANGNDTTFVYDGHDRLYEMHFPDATTGNSTSSSPDFERYTYDANGNLTEKLTRASDKIVASYDVLNRISQKDPQKFSVGATSPVDAPTVTYTYDLVGRQTHVDDVTNSLYLSYTYDAAGRNLTVTREDGKVVSYEYDQAGNRNKLTYPGADSFYVRYTYDGLNRLDKIEEKASGVFLADYGYDTLSRRTSLAHTANSTSVAYVYDDDNDLLQLNNAFVGGSLNYNPMLYNAAGQVTQVPVSDDQYLWTTPANGNKAYAPNGLNQYASVASTPFTYDANGNLLDDGPHTYTYDVENRLVAAANDDTQQQVTYTYDPTGPRRSKNVDGSVTGYVSDGGEEIAEYDGAGALLRRFVHGAGVDERVAVYEGPAASAVRYFYHADRQGSTVALTNGSGAVSGRVSYSPYAEIGLRDGYTGPFLYSGRRYDDETGLYYYRARYYSPSIGRFLQTDPIGYGDGINMYAYAANDPVNNIDPTGTECHTITTATGPDVQCNADEIKTDPNKNKGKPTTEDQKKIAVTMADLANYIKGLEKHKDRDVLITETYTDPKTGKSASRDAHIKAGYLAMVLRGQHLIADLSQTGQGLAANTVGLVTTFGRDLLSPNGAALPGVSGPIPGTSGDPSMIRMIMWGHEGLHNTYVNNIQNVIPQPLQRKFHQGAFNQGAYDLWNP